MFVWRKQLLALIRNEFEYTLNQTAPATSVRRFILRKYSKKCKVIACGGKYKGF
jgi:hypothetical protein